MTAVNFNPASIERRTSARRTAGGSSSIPQRDSEPAQSAEHDELDRATNCIRLRDRQTEPQCDDATDAGS